MDLGVMGGNSKLKTKNSKLAIQNRMGGAKKTSNC
jgi:hypothetical protein